MTVEVIHNNVYYWVHGLCGGPSLRKENFIIIWDKSHEVYQLTILWEQTNTGEEYHDAQ